MAILSLLEEILGIFWRKPPIIGGKMTEIPTSGETNNLKFNSNQPRKLMRLEDNFFKQRERPAELQELQKLKSQ